MSFYESTSGTKIDGSAEAAHIPDVFATIPNNTKAKAQIVKIELFTLDYGKFYQITWRLVEGDYTNYQVRQKLHCFDKDQDKQDRAKNMLVRLFVLNNWKPAHSNEPNEQDLKPLVGKELGIVIRQYHIKKDDGKVSEGNFVSEIHPITSTWENITGKLIEYKSKSADNTHKQSLVDDDIPF